MKHTLTLIIVGLLAGQVLAKDVDWEHNYDAALEKAKKEKKLVMVDIYTDWCGWCKKLDRDTYTDKTVQAALAKGFISVKVNPEKSKKNREVEDKLGKTGYPHIVFVDAAGTKLTEIRGYARPDDFLKYLEEASKKASAK